MNILITGTTGYIAKRLIPELLHKGHRLVCTVRDLERVPAAFKDHPNIDFIKVDFLNTDNVTLPTHIDVAYYLIHSMSTSQSDFGDLEAKCAYSFRDLIANTDCKQVIYLSGIVNDNTLSKHLKSRLQVEEILNSGYFALTVFRAGIIVGSGSASFEIIRDLVEKLPVMVTPKWLHTKSQPIAIRDVITYLTEAMGREDLFDKAFDIFGPEVLTYKDMLLQFAEVRGLRRWIFTLPVLSPRLSSYWLFFVTSTSYNLAASLVESMKVEVIGRASALQSIIPLKTLTYREAVRKAFKKIEQNSVVSSWKDSLVSGVMEEQPSRHIHVPEYGCFQDERRRKINSEDQTLERIWQIGGATGWYSANFLWKIRGYIDKIFGGVGLRRGRRHPSELAPGDALDFWRVLLANRKEKRLLLLAEMKLPGEAWLEFSIKDSTLYQRAVFRPNGVWGRLYWWMVFPFHGVVFNGMINRLART